jgi:hypothetical protein
MIRDVTSNIVTNWKFFAGVVVAVFVAETINLWPRILQLFGIGG